MTQQEVESKDNSLLPDEVTKEETFDNEGPHSNEYGYRNLRLQDQPNTNLLRVSQEAIDLRISEAPLFEDDLEAVILEEGSEFGHARQGAGSQIYVDSLLSSDRKRSDSPKLTHTHNNAPFERVGTQNFNIAAPPEDLESPGLSIKFKEFSVPSAHGFKGTEVSPISNPMKLLPGLQNHFYSAPKAFQLSGGEQAFQRGSDGFIEREIHVPFATEDESGSASKLASDRSSKVVPAGEKSAASKITVFLNTKTERPLSGLSRGKSNSKSGSSQTQLETGVTKQATKSTIVSNNNFLRAISPLHGRGTGTNKSGADERGPSPVARKPILPGFGARRIDQEALIRVQRKNEGRRNLRVGLTEGSRLVEGLLKLRTENPFQKKPSRTVISTPLQSILDRTSQIKSRSNSKSKEQSSNITLAQFKLNSKPEVLGSRNNSNTSKKQHIVEGFRPTSSRGNSLSGQNKPQPQTLGSSRGSNSTSSLFSKLFNKGARSAQGHSLEGQTRIHMTEQETSTNSTAIDVNRIKPKATTEFQQMLKKIHPGAKLTGAQSASTLGLAEISNSSLTLNPRSQKPAVGIERATKSPSLVKKAQDTVQLLQPLHPQTASRTTQLLKPSKEPPSGDLLALKPTTTFSREITTGGSSVSQIQRGIYQQDSKQASQKKLESRPQLNLDNVAPVKPQQTSQFTTQQKVNQYLEKINTGT